MKYLFLSFLLFSNTSTLAHAKTLEKSSCIKLKNININDTDILYDENIKKLFNNLQGKCIDNIMFKKILTSISQYYTSKGYITKKPYLKEQDIKDGNIDISISQGLIEDIVDVTTKKGDWSIKTAFIFQKNNFLNLRDLETSLEMINRVPSVDAKFEITPGTKQGYSIINITTKKDFPYHLQIGITGEKYVYDSPYLNFELSIDNPLNINDILSIRYNTSNVQKFYQSSSGSEINYSFSLGSYLLEFIWFNLKYNQQVIGLNDSYIADGLTNGGSVKVSKILFRNQHNIFKSSLSLDTKNSKNYFANELLDISSYITSVAQIDLSYIYLANWGQLSTIYSYYHGTNWFGARDDSYITQSIKETQAKLQFDKHTLNFTLFYNFNTTSYRLDSNLYLQYSNDYLFDINKLKIGSFYTVRGYSTSYYGSTGAYIKNDFVKTFYPNIDPIYIKTVSTFIGLDYGEIKCENDNQLGCGSLFGSAIGIKTQSKNLDTDFTFSRSIKNISSLKLETLFRYNLTLKF